MAGLAASAGVVVVVVVSAAAASSWLFLSPDDCFAELSACPDPWTWPGSAACASAFGFAAFGCEAELGLAGFWALAVVPSCAEGLLSWKGAGPSCWDLPVVGSSGPATFARAPYCCRPLRPRSISSCYSTGSCCFAAVESRLSTSLGWPAAIICLRAGLLLGGRGIEQGGKRLGSSVAALARRMAAAVTPTAQTMTSN